MIKKEKNFTMSQIDVPITENWCETESKILNYNFMWTIHNFSVCAEKPGEKISSTSFSDPSQDSSISWVLDLYPRGITPEFENCLSIQIICNNVYNKSISVKCQVFILNKNMQQAKELQFVHNFNSTSKEYGFWEFIKRQVLEDKKDDYLPDDKLKILCRIKANMGYNNVANKKQIVSFQKENFLCNQLQGFVGNEKFSDFTLIAEGNKFNVHKILLAARSIVFAAMFENNMIEKKENLANISDIKHEVLKEMLRFIYTEEVENMKKFAIELLIASDKFVIDNLKSKCEEFLSNILTINNCVDLVDLADCYHADNLKKEAIKFIIANAEQVIETSNFKNILQEHVMVQVFEAMTIKKVTEKKSWADVITQNQCQLFEDDECSSIES